MRTSTTRLVLLMLAFFFASSAQAQAPGDFSRAVFASKSDNRCPAGSFWDPKGECWSCPAGYNRTLYPVTSGKACSQSAERLSKATFHHKTGCGKGEFFDPRNGGECWQCPANRPRRTLYPVTDSRACATAAIFGEQLSRAEFKGKVGKCTGSQFFDPRNGGECWSCPASEPRRTLHPVTDDRACASKEILAETFAQATFVNKSVPFVCAPGQFWDPRNGGECWSCPAQHPFRTVNAVHQDMACAKNFVQIFVPDWNAACKGLITGLAMAANGAQGAQDEIDKTLGGFSDALSPLLTPLEREMVKLSQTITSATQLDKLYGELAKVIDKNTLQQILHTGSILQSQPSGLVKVLLDEKLICEKGNGAKLTARLRQLGLGPTPKVTSGPLGNFLITSAQAATPRVLWALAITGGGTVPFKAVGVGATVSLAFVTDFKEMHGLYFIFGPQVTSAKGLSGGVAISFMVYPYAALPSEIDLTVLAPYAQLSVAPNESLRKHLPQVHSGSSPFHRSFSFDIALDLVPFLASLENLEKKGAFVVPPGFGVGGSRSVSVGDTTSKFKVVDVTGSVNWAIPIVLGPNNQ